MGVPMTALLGALFSLYLLYLLWEAHAVRIARKKLAHVVHVNGTRGKSTVSPRLCRSSNYMHIISQYGKAGLSQNENCRK